jgi:glucose dehydrogenase
VQAPTLLDLKQPQGGAVRAVGAAGKSGYYATLDAGSGELLARTGHITRYSLPHLRPTRKGTVVCPGIFGGLEYGPASFSPERESLYVAGNQMCMGYKLEPRGAREAAAPRENNLAGTAEQVGPATGVLAALDPAGGKIRRRVPLPRPANGVEYVAIAAAGSLVEAKGTAPERPGRLFVFCLSG